MTRNTSYAIELRAGDPLPVSSTWIGGISQQAIRPGVQVNTELTAGSHYVVCIGGNLETFFYGGGFTVEP